MARSRSGGGGCGWAAECGGDRESDTSSAAADRTSAVVERTRGARAVVSIRAEGSILFSVR